MRSDEAVLVEDTLPFRDSVSSLARAGAGTGSAFLSVATVLGLFSSPVVFSVAFLDRNTSRRRLVEDCFERDWGGVKPVLLARRDEEADSRLSTLPC